MFFFHLNLVNLIYWANSYNPEFTLTLQGCYIIAMVQKELNLNLKSKPL